MVARRGELAHPDVGDGVGRGQGHHQGGCRREDVGVARQDHQRQSPHTQNQGEDQQGQLGVAPGGGLHHAFEPPFAL